MTFTIFTPTYNRVHTLPRLYDSLVAQHSEDFEWLIVDDGSTDETKSLVESFISENKIPIRYFFQQNSGKHIAINKGLKEARGIFFWTLDSDDYLKPNALHTAKSIVKRLPQDVEGFTAIRFTDDIPYKPKDFGKREWTKEGYEWPFHGEMGFFFKTSIAKQYPFPVFPNEKFCQESLILRRILQNHKILYTDYVLVGGNYLEDGLSQNIYQRLKKNPRYSMLNTAERIAQKTYKSDEEKLQLAKVYWDIALSAKHIPWSEKIKGLPITLTVKVFLEKIKKKWKKK